jgi:hypothetical protein
MTGEPTQPHNCQLIYTRYRPCPAWYLFIYHVVLKMFVQVPFPVTCVLQQCYVYVPLYTEVPFIAFVSSYRPLLLLPLGACKEEARSSSTFFKEDEAVPPVCTWRHGRNHLLLVDECAERQGRGESVREARTYKGGGPPYSKEAPFCDREVITDLWVAKEADAIDLGVAKLADTERCVSKGQH